MKKIITFLLISFIFSSLSGQILYQEGMAREINSDRKPLGGVFIKFENAASTNSDDDGNFKLTFKNKKEGDLIFLEEIKKSGYELVNRKDFEVTKISNIKLLGVDVILAATGYVNAAKKEYYGVSDKALLAGFEKEKKVLRNQLNAAQLNQEEYLSQTQNLQEQYERQKESLDALADKFARVNFDDVDKIYKDALLLFKSGDIDGCKLKLKNADLIGRTDKMLAKKKAHEDNINQINKDLKKAIQPIQLEVETHLLSFEFKEAENLYDQLLKLDSTNLEILHEVAHFYREKHLYAKAKKTYPKIIAHPAAEPWQIANAHSHMGSLFSITGSLAKARERYTLSSKSYKNFLSVNPDNLIFKINLAISYEKLGEIHTALGNLDKTLKYYEDALDLSKQLYEAYPNNMELKNGLAISYEKLGETHSALGNLDKALKYYEDGLDLTIELCKAYPDNVKFKNGLAISYQFLGNTHTSLGNLDKALKYFEEYNKLEKQLYKAYPNNVSFKNGLAVSYSKLGLTYTAMGNLDMALNFFEQYNQLEKQLFEAYPNNVSFKNGLAISYEKLGETHSALGNSDMALNFFEQRSDLGKQLFEAYPNNVSFKNGLAISYYKLGSTYSALGNLDKAFKYYEYDLDLTKQLYEAYPNNVSFKNGLAISYYKLGDFCKKNNQTKKARNYFLQAEKLWKELTIDTPQYAQFKKFLSIVQNDIENLE